MRIKSKFSFAIKAVLLGLLPALFSPMTSAVGLNSGLMAYYPFDGNSNDASGNSNHGTINGGVTLTTDHNGNANSAYLFNGTDGYISISDAPSLHPVNQMTISAWVRKDDLSASWAAIIDKGSAGKGADPTGCYPSEEYALYINNDLRFNFESAEGFDCSRIHLYGKPVSLGKWHHMAVVIDRKTKHLIQMYADGVLQVQQADNYNAFNSSSEELRVGFSLDLHSGSLHFKGAIDDIRLYNRVLAASEIKALYIPVNGTIKSMATHTVTCLNTTTAQSITIPATATTTYNCEAEGLVIKPQDHITITIDGSAQ